MCLFTSKDLLCDPTEEITAYKIVRPTSGAEYTSLYHPIFYRIGEETRARSDHNSKEVYLSLARAYLLMRSAHLAAYLSEGPVLQVDHGIHVYTDLLPYMWDIAQIMPSRSIRSMSYVVIAGKARNVFAYGLKKWSFNQAVCLSFTPIREVNPNG